MDARPDAALTRAARGNLVGQARVTRRQRAGLVTLLLVAGLHAWLLLQWSGLTAAGWSRAWPVAPAHHAVVQVASVQSAPALQAMRDGRVAAAAEVTEPQESFAMSGAPVPARPGARRANAPSPTPSPSPSTPNAPALAAPALAAQIPVAAATIATAPALADAAEHGDEPSAVRGAEGTLPSAPPPLYATRMPAPTRLRYAVQIGQRKGQAELDWQHDGQHYRLQLDVAAPGGPAWQQTSSGAFDAAGLAPQRFVDRRGRRAERAANFQRETGRISFSGPAVEYPLLDGAQDRLGFIVQLAAIASAASAASAAGQVPSQVALFVVDARGLGDVWTFVNQGAVIVDGPLGALPSVYLLREAQRLNDWRVEAWLDPQRGFWPARLRMTVARSGAVFELTLAQEPQTP